MTTELDNEMMEDFFENPRDIPANDGTAAEQISDDEMFDFFEGTETASEKNKTVLNEDAEEMERKAKSEIELATYNMADEMTKMATAVATMMTKNLMPLVDEIKQHYSKEAGEMYNTAIHNNLSKLVDEMTAAKDVITDQVANLDNPEAAVGADMMNSDMNGMDEMPAMDGAEGGEGMGDTEGMPDDMPADIPMGDGDPEAVAAPAQDFADIPGLDDDSMDSAPLGREEKE